MQRIALSLSGHTNLGKTTLARTLLRRDIGEVDDRPHVTDIAEAHVLIGDEEAMIVLWDLPGFGDSVKLLGRLERQGWLAWLRESFDRWTDRALWCSQQCVRNARDDADVVLYLVDARHDPAGSPEVMAEMAILAWVGKPVILLLNQTGMPDGQRDAALAKAWREALARFEVVRDVVALDGWVRCWVQEVQLMERIAPLVSGEKRGAFDRLRKRWEHERHHKNFVESMRLLGAALAETAADAAQVERESAIERLGSVLAGRLSPQRAAARRGLVDRLVARSRKTMEALIRLHELDGVPRDRVDSAIQGLKERNPSAPPEIWGLIGGIGSGALAGLVADIKAGGLTFGGGAVLGAVGGGLAAYALGYGYRMGRGDDGCARMSWSAGFLRDELKAAGMRYLIVAHMGRGRGRWEEPLSGELPDRWRESIEGWIAANRGRIDRAFVASGDERGASRLEAIVSSMLGYALAEMYGYTRAVRNLSDSVR
jgi:nucleoside 2-deoxyribosyltransferase